MLRARWLIGGLSAAVVAVVLWRASAHSGDSQAAAGSRPPADGRRPKAVAVDNVHHFGVMFPGEVRRRKFTVRNDGDADLVLNLARTTCKCTLAEVNDRRVPPGGAEQIELEWRTEHPQFRFRQAAVVDTNDPDAPQFELAVEGSVRVKLASVPEEAYFGDVPRNAERKLNVLLYSQAYDRVRIQAVESTLPEVWADVDFLPPLTAPPEGSRYFRDLVLRRRPQSRTGPFDGVVRIRYVGRLRSGTEESGVYELPVRGEVVGDVSFHGRSVVGRQLDLGQLARSESRTEKVYVHFRDAAVRPQLSVARRTPEFLEVRVGPRQQLSSTVTRVPLEVRVPAGSPAVNFTGDAVGAIELTTDHPDYPTLRLNVALLVGP